MMYLLFRLFLILVRLMPFRINGLFGKLMGRAYYRLDRQRRRIIQANLCVAFGRELDNRRREILGRESCEYLVMHILDLLKFNTMVDAKNYTQFIEIKGLSNLMKSTEKGKGTIVVMGHFGNFFLVRYACYLDIPQRAAIIRKLDNPFFEGFVGSIFETHNVIMVRPEGALQKMFRLLKRNTVTATLADQKAGGNPRVGRHGIIVDFFGIPSQTHITAPLLARRTGASIVPVFVIRKGPGKYRIEANEPLLQVRTEDETSDLEKNTRKLNEIFEEYIRKYPRHWFWLHKRWKDIPGLEDLYDSANPLELIDHFWDNLRKG